MSRAKELITSLGVTDKNENNSKLARRLANDLSGVASSSRDLKDLSESLEEWVDKTSSDYELDEESKEELTEALFTRIQDSLLDTFSLTHDIENVLPLDND